MVKLLLEKGANINVITSSQTPLVIIAKWGYKAIVKLLLDKGADINTADKNGRTALL